MILLNLQDGEEKSSPFANRLRNTYKHLRKWAKRTDTDCFRLFDRDISSYPVAVDYYAGRFSVQYFAKSKEGVEPPQVLQDEVNTAISRLFGVGEESIYWRTRMRRKESRQYEKIAAAKEFFVVKEFGASFYVNLTDYLDTGLFLDHRETRKLVSSYAENKRVLNLFAYTGAFTVHAALAGASYTKTVDLSNTYCAWARENLELNGIPKKQNEIFRADCLKFLDDEIKRKVSYDLIIVDPPTISRSKKMDELFDVQQDYATLIAKSLKLLNPHGRIFFSTNARKFVFDQGLLPPCIVREISDKTLPLDFKDEKIHRCWIISHSENLSGLG